MTNRILDWIAAAIMMAALACAGASPVPANDCDRWDCGEDIREQRER